MSHDVGVQVPPRAPDCLPKLKKLQFFTLFTLQQIQSSILKKATKRSGNTTKQSKIRNLNPQRATHVLLIINLPLLILNDGGFKSGFLLLGSFANNNT